MEVPQHYNLQLMALVIYCTTSGSTCKRICVHAHQFPANKPFSGTFAALSTFFLRST